MRNDVDLQVILRRNKKKFLAKIIYAAFEKFSIGESERYV